ncbi:hypothetical protein B0T44_04260 [Nocardia donostiensis]|uniref:Uncharacterized protein n=2 Tax=Nocardia donostiensis TaxID=1538463 RepID=A0A1V2TH47_9NOCA|nr:hypothetical protein B0T46_10205 [Nocardia donostiensis]OQS22899.1 hypothetical protein B0T44_04260 [Nocardia donostiensis]
MLRWASAIMITLGVGHLVILVLTAGQHIGTWVGRGLWSTVPFLDRDAASVDDAVTFWSGPGGFAVPLILLGCLLWHLAKRGVPIPAGIGWVLMTWGLLDGVLLGPSPFFAAIVPGALIGLAARKHAVEEKVPGPRPRRDLRRHEGVETSS